MTDAARGILWMVATTLLFACVNTVVRYLGSDLPASVSAFVRYAISTVVLLPVLFRMVKQNSQPDRQSVSGPVFYGIRGLAHGLAVILWFYAMARLPLSEVTAIGYMQPIFVTIGAALFLRERLSVRRGTALLVGFAGMLIIIRPGLSAVSTGQAAMLLAAAMFGVSYLLAKKMAVVDPPIFVLTGLGAGVTCVLAPFAIWNWQTPSPVEFFWLGVVALLATSGHFTMTKALQLAPISTTQPVNFLQLVWAALIGMMFFGEQAEWQVLAGAVLVISATSYITWREQQLGKSDKQAAGPPG